MVSPRIAAVRMADGNPGGNSMHSRILPRMPQFTELRPEELPQAVRQAFASSEYARYGIEDAEYIETPDKNYYRLETEVNDRDIYLDFMADGTPITI